MNMPLLIFKRKILLERISNKLLGTKTLHFPPNKIQKSKYDSRSKITCVCLTFTAFYRSVKEEC